MWFSRRGSREGLTAALAVERVALPALLLERIEPEALTGPSNIDRGQRHRGRVT